MCIMSFVGDYARDTIPKRYPWVQPEPTISPNTATFISVPPAITREEFDALKAEVEALKKLLGSAKEYDEATGQPDCEMEEKIAFLRSLAEFVGVDLEDVLGAEGAES